MYNYYQGYNVSFEIQFQCSVFIYPISNGAQEEPYISTIQLHFNVSHFKRIIHAAPCETETPARLINSISQTVADKGPFFWAP